MADPIIISGTTGPDSERRFCQFWGPHKIAGRERDECMASMANTDGLQIDRDCPQAWLSSIWEAFNVIVGGGIPAATHTVVWQFGRPVFTPITPEGVIDQPAFDLEGIS